MFKELRKKFILTNMLTATAILVLAGVAIFGFSSIRHNMQPPVPSEFSQHVEQEDLFREGILQERRESRTDLLFILIIVGILVELLVFGASYYLAERSIKPVEEAYEKQKDFIANASHELKTPMAVIQANFEALDLGKDAEPWAGNINKEIAHANTLVLDLLNLARLDVGDNTKQTLTEVDLNDILAKRIELFEPRFSGKMNLKGAKTSVKTVEQDLKQVLDILLDNAVKYGDKKINVEILDSLITVKNDGAKIAPEDLNNIFDRFYQTDKTREGSGLGLAIAKSICEKNGWKIWAESDRTGTKFSLSLKG